MHDFIRSPDLLFIFQLAPSPAYVDTVSLDEIRTKLCPSHFIGSAVESNCYEFCTLNAPVSLASWCFPLTVNYISISLTLSAPGGGGGLRGPDGQTHSCQSETSYPMMPKLGDF